MELRSRVTRPLAEALQQRRAPESAAPRLFYSNAAYATRPLFQKWFPHATSPYWLTVHVGQWAAASRLPHRVRDEVSWRQPIAPPPPLAAPTCSQPRRDRTPQRYSVPLSTLGAQIYLRRINVGDNVAGTQRSKEECECERQVRGCSARMPLCCPFSWRDWNWGASTPLPGGDLLGWIARSLPCQFPALSLLSGSDGVLGQ
ncbi:hypothetical protein B0H14DRAFT_2652954 [Mycena olivaceomarginata]|nr:hypothetical protein B0H14DRAFT_2652954 [Mycena olivaceomarginata]